MEPAPEGGWEVTATIHQLKPKRGLCAHCGQPFLKRLASNDPAYDTYECGVAGQPDKVKADMRPTPGVNRA
jgi:hypothetical protein